MGSGGGAWFHNVQVGSTNGYQIQHFQNGASADPFAYNDYFTRRFSIMASELKVDKFTGVSTAGSILVTGEGNSTTTNLQQGLAKSFFFTKVHLLMLYMTAIILLVLQMLLQENKLQILLII